MIKIIEEHHNNIKRVTCPMCGSVLEYGQEDIVCSVDTDNTHYKSIECPICDEIIFL